MARGGGAQGASAESTRRLLRSPPERIAPGPPRVAQGDAESESVWGFRDTAFQVNAAGHVVLSGSRYELAGHELRGLLPWAREILDVELAPGDRNPSRYPPELPEPRRSPAFESALRGFLAEGQISSDPLLRLRRAHGHTQEEMYAIKYEGLPRIPDLVVWPASEEQVEALVRAAREHGACLIPYGGGTNVTDALRCPEDEERVIASVDMGRMNRVLWIDPLNRMACIQAGAVGREIQAELAAHGFALGHEPDSVEFSTLGGWIATYASGMKKNRYGNIEDLVLDLRAVTAQGTLGRASVVPRESTGVDARRMLFGSEGSLGIVTSAVLKIFPLPEVQKYGSILFRDFEAGVAFLYALERAGGKPASVRLVDNLQFQFSQALRPAADGWRALRSRLERLYVTRLRGFDPRRMVACTLVFEGSREEVRAQEGRTYALARRHGGLAAGAENGKRGYQLTFAIAYIRDFMMDHWILAESFETSVPWGRVLPLCQGVKQRLWQEHGKRHLPGRPFVTCRVTQLYETGVCVYFYFGYCYKGVKYPTRVYAEMEAAAREEVLRCGGSLSHHHGVGKLRRRFLPAIQSPASLECARAAKRALDPENVFGCGNQDLGPGG
jgi:alkyldihydroxyacetonephosphate synthase